VSIAKRKAAQDKPDGLTLFAAGSDTMNDEDIDFSDIPELTAEQLADAVRARELRRSLYKPIKIAVKINYDADVLQWFRSFGKGYQTRMNAALREYMLMHL
jgi:uncharacterized protein (DUF4415 family)